VTKSVTSSRGTVSSEEALTPLMAVLSWVVIWLIMGVTVAVVAVSLVSAARDGKSVSMQKYPPGEQQ
jgi:hypothetical protein